MIPIQTIASIIISVVGVVGVIISLLPAGGLVMG